MDLSRTPIELVESVYKTLTENISTIRERKNAPLTLAEKIASWNPLDALSVNHSEGNCCDYCEFKQTCAEFR